MKILLAPLFAIVAASFAPAAAAQDKFSNLYSSRHYPPDEAH